MEYIKMYFQPHCVDSLGDETFAQQFLFLANYYYDTNNF